MIQNNIKIYKKELSKLIKNYKSKLVHLGKESIDNKSISLAYFITYLQYMRDRYILSEPDTPENEIKIATLAVIIDAYHGYLSCNIAIKQLTDEESKKQKNIYKQKKCIGNVFVIY